MTAIKRASLGRGSARLQSGLAAIEFALVFVVLFLAVYGVASVGAVLYVQQVVSRSAEDGARAALQLSLDVAANDSRVQSAVYQSLASSSITPSAAGSSIASKFAWLKSNVPASLITVDLSIPTQITVRVAYPYGSNPIVPPLPFTGLAVPTNLRGKATTAKPLP
ncbi:TadE/TadG family type IV pilus assembly protein [Variovorax sp. efr-133-TYG-130]|uniref:TadE/TadG family type IV pilus assembly protein n=1 Tax=Variovorax sp. efr-133-TYG-130 TaxID=3040327 RepID=UPI0025535570|nr:TadE/TadG family type IV pilus assembly protein [Variovorax sp. efr-133-TYG-130]